MRIPRIYVAQPLTEHQTTELNEASSHYISKVLRLNEGAPLILFNGQGGQFDACIEAVSKKWVTVTVQQQHLLETESPLSIHLGIAISKGDRMDWVIQKATELGVTEITPLLSARVELKLKGERLEKKLQHWQKIAISACEQCGRNRIPTVHKLLGIDQWLTSVQADKKLVLHHRTEQTLNSDDEVNKTALLIGPEGGLNETEINDAEKNGFQAMQLGPRVLRTETAPLVAITLLQSVWAIFNSGCKNDA
ncbi:16S rRNA (uracil(1498)-N(3))-methyltransferase [Oceanicoccus sp. KOV_DT_Chl]|uniref:16S rRNA (uracil(1498)-N(3))-methyltransferase n=1 Tax=Oceanicoccus sp. KOV_DT_Chl TaxID=1904639 RepID=UPI000C7AEEE8|nr:16S rRNA (uracil(1498)-N(3))-methyltransferase [Oceanicoccus sp. KOV_DT_Chl]